MSWLFVALTACLSVGDEVPEDEFAEAFAPLFCAREAECAKGLYQSLYFDRADCVAHWEQALADQLDTFDDFGCSYDAGEAADAFDTIKDMSCEDYYEGEDLADLSADIWADCSSYGYTTSYYGYYTYYDY